MSINACYYLQKTQLAKIMKKTLLCGLLLFVVLFMTACAAGPNELVHTVNPGGEIAGFWMGLWHGLIAPITFIVSLFNCDVGIYELHNNGGWYNFGFVLGLMTIFSGSHGAGRRSSSSKE